MFNSIAYRHPEVSEIYLNLIAYIFSQPDYYEDKKFQASNPFSVFLGDRELAALNAVEVVFPTIKIQLCVFHIDRDIEAKCLPIFSKLAVSNYRDVFDEFLSNWRALRKAGI